MEDEIVDVREEMKIMRERFSVIKRVKSFANAGRGLRIFIRTTHNAWIQLCIFILAIILGFVFKISYIDWMLLVLAAGMVLVAEAFNTAIEVQINLVSPGIHPFARDAKDIAAGAVLLASLFAIVIGLGIFGHHLVNAFISFQ